MFAEDDDGTWIGGRAGTRVAWRDETSYLETETTLDVAVLIPPSAWWIAAWWSNGDITVDVAAPARFERGIWVFEDLELDLYLLPSGSHGIVDVDEFLDAVDADQIVADEREMALRTAGNLERMLKAREEPFGEVGWARFREAQALGLSLLDPPDGDGPVA